MIKNKKIVAELHRQILKSYNPRNNSKSACAHRIDWTELPEEKFNDIYEKALEERNKQHG